MLHAIIAEKVSRNKAMSCYWSSARKILDRTTSIARLEGHVWTTSKRTPRGLRVGCLLDQYRVRGRPLQKAIPEAQVC